MINHLIVIKRLQGGLAISYDAGSNRACALMSMAGLIEGFMSQGFAIWEAGPPCTYRAFRQGRQASAEDIDLEIWLEAPNAERVN